MQREQARIQRMKDAQKAATADAKPVEAAPQPAQSAQSEPAIGIQVSEMMARRKLAGQFNHKPPLNTKFDTKDQ
jgi:hypothetical protein